MKDIDSQELYDMQRLDVEEVWRRNRVVPERIRQCVHDLIKTTAKHKPLAPAICAWDGEMTYGELDELSTKLGRHLISLGVKPEDIVPLCFEKSMWTIVAMWAVLKAGGAFTPINPEHPRTRQGELLIQTGARVVLVSAQCSTLWKDLDQTLVTVSGQSIDQLPVGTSETFPSIKHDNMAYVMFTSGSTGTPKGVVLEHEAVSTSCLAHGRTFGFSSQTRAFQFADYTFDVCITEIITTLIFGGCVCIPSEVDRRNDLAKAMTAMNVNLALLTPSVARLLKPHMVTCLDTLVLAGEQVTTADWMRWQNQVHIINGYGPAEACVFCVAFTSLSDFKQGTIGKSMASVSWVVDPEDHNVLAPIGSVGELLVEGPILARGYLHDPKKTNAAFITNPSWLRNGGGGHLGRLGRMYKTGDLVQYDTAGNLVYIGRKDTQVKVRGQRVELGEIEHHVRECMTLPDARQIAVEAILPKGGGNNAMVAAFIQLNDEADDGPPPEEAGKTGSPARVVFPSGMDEKLAERLPGYMVPDVYFAIQNLPMTASGKTDRRRLREIGASFSAQQLAEVRTFSVKRPPSTEVEKMMQGLWAQVLNIQPGSIGLDDNFFRLGGDSIAAMRLIGEVRRAGLQLSVADLFRQPKLEEAASVAIAAASSSPDIGTIPRVTRDGPTTQSFAQGRLWFLEQLYPGLTWYLIPFAFRIKGPLQIAALERALLAVESRHETLRTVFSTNGDTNLQTVQRFQAKELNIVDILLEDEQGFEKSIQRDQATPFNLQHEPGWRVTLYRVSGDDHVLSILMHHIISDGWSTDLLMRELATFYSASIRGQDPLSQVQPLPIQYSDFSLWQKQPAQIDEHQRQLRYWHTQLHSSRPAELLYDKPRPTTLSGSADIRKLYIGDSLYAQVQEFCKERGVTLFVVLLAVFRVTHYRLTRQDDATFGTVNANRDRWELRDMIGLFVNMQCLRIPVQEDISFEELVRQVNEINIASLANQDIPFESIVSSTLTHDRDMSRHPLVQLVFVVHSQQDLGKLTLEGVETHSLQGLITTRFDLEFHFYHEPNGNCLRGELVFSTDLYAPETISNMLSLFRRVLEECLQHPHITVTSLPLLSDTSYAELNEMGLLEVQQTTYPRESSIVDLFHEEVSKYPQKVAVVDSSAEMTYAELDRASDTVAWWLKRQSFTPESLVGVFIPRSCQAVIAFLGILKATLAYLPYDIGTPPARMEAILASIPSQRLVFVSDDIPHPEIKLEHVDFVSITSVLDAGDKSICPELGLQPSATSLAYVMFTSGSTGKPKGVMVEHRGVVRLAKQNNLVQHLPAPPIMAHMANLAFDASTWEIYASLLNGGTLVCIDVLTVLDPEAVLKISCQYNIRTALITPTLFRQYALECPALISQFDTLCIGAEPLHLHDLHAAEKLLTGKLINCYGPTENACISTTFIFTLDGNEKCINTVPIGRAISNSGAYVMDSNMCLVPLGVIGELVVTGDGLARGYTDPERNIDRFVSITIGGRVLEAYRTGDYVRYRPTDGQLEIFGRMDAQVKIRGQRVELGEVEYILRSHEAVSDAVAVVQNYDGDEVCLDGFITIDELAVMVAEQGDAGEGDALQHVDTWEEQFNSDYYSPIRHVQPETIGRDFIGWTSMYDGSEIDKAEMHEWLDDTIDTLLNGHPPGRVLEIGSGTGMILFNLCNGLEGYVGLDPSQKAVDFIAGTAKSTPLLTGKVRMYKATAADIGRLQRPLTANLVVINSVAQYFPSQEYMFKVVQDILKVDGVRAIFFGDVRSHALYREFLATRAVRMAGDKATKVEIRRMMADMERAELEFLVDPAFFTALPSRLPHLIEHVEILPKKMRATNELSCYRYAAVVHAKRQDGRQLEVRVIEDDGWIDFAAQGLDRQSLLQLLKSLAGSTTAAVCNIPYSKTIFSRYLVDSLIVSKLETADDDDWLSTVHQKAQHCPSLSAIDLDDLANEAGCRVEISWKRQHSQHGALDAIFHRYQPKNGDKRVLFHFPSDFADRPLHSLSSKPLRQQFVQKVRQQLQETLKARVPEYMVPRSITILDAMPINQNGKVDRKMLLQQRQTQTASRRPVLVKRPVSKAEKAMQKLWAQVLRIGSENIGLDDSFFRLGGDSIAAMKLVGKAREIGLQLAVADVFRNPQLAELSGVNGHTYTAKEIPAFSLLRSIDVAQVRKEVAASCHVETTFVEDVYPCSPLQEGLISLTSKKPGDYIMQSVLHLRLDVDEMALQAAWDHVAQLTTVLRTRIVHNSQLGLLQAVIAGNLEWREAENLEEYLENDKSVSMGLGDPLVRHVIVKDRKSSGQRWLVWTIHHALYDGWSLPLILDAVTEAYNGATLQKKPGFHAFIKYLDQMDRDAASTYWKNALADCEATPFPTLPPAVQQPVAVTTLKLQYPALPDTFSDITTSTLVRGAWAIVTSRHTNSDDIVFGATVTGRSAPVAGIEAITGPTIATVPIRVRVHKDYTVSTFLQGIQEQALEMIPYEQTGLQQISKLTTGARHACGFQTLLVVQPASDESESAKTLGQWHSNSNLQGFTTYGLVIQCILAAKSVRITASFDENVIDQWLVKKLLDQFSFVIQKLSEVQRPQTKVVDIDTLTPEDKRDIWEWNNDIPAPVERCIHDLFADQASIRPRAPAICAWDGETMTYSELDELSTRLAGHLAKLSVKPDDIVPLCFEKSLWTIVAMLAVLKAGGAFLLLDPSLPYERRKLMCRKAASTFALASPSCARGIQSLIKNVVTVTRATILQIPRIPQSWTATVQPTDSAYVIFTSGSTGEPKGCRIEHRSACSALVSQKNIGMHTETRTLQFGSYAFAGALAEILLTLVHGGCICIPSEEERISGPALASAISRMQTSWAFLTSTVLDLLTPESVPSLITLCVGGEPIRISQAIQWRNQVHLRQTYGSSETSGFVSSERLTECSTTRDIGKALTSAYWIVDPNDYHKLLPIGAIGEILIEGPVLGREYIGDPEKTASTFLEPPAWRASFGKATPPLRFYRIGDLGRYKKDGSIELLGRKDSQVKLRGQRIELEEIEHQARLARTDTKEIVVELINPHDSTGILACFVVNDNNTTNDQEETDGQHSVRVQNAIRMIQERLEQFLPQYMVPTVFVPIAHLPRTTSNKLDRKRLREIGDSLSAQQLAEMRSSGEQKRSPTTKAEKTMQRLWGQMLKIRPDSIGLEDNFFRLGGDSITAMKLVGEAYRTGLRLTVADLFRNPRLDQAAASVTITSASSPIATIPRVEYVGPTEQSFAQGRLWFMEQLYPGLTWYLIPFAFRIKGSLQLTALSKALLTVESRHETLRTTFNTNGDTGFQEVQPFVARELNIIDVDDEHGLQNAVRQDQTTPFDLRKDPGWRATVYRLNSHDHVLSIVIHHIISDGWSVDLLIRELSTLYSASVRDQDPLSQAPLPIRYKDFSVWQRQQAQIDEHQRQLDYWCTQLQTSRPAELLCDKPRPSTLSGRAAIQTLQINDQLYTQLHDFCQVNKVTLFVVLLAVFRITHYRLTGQDDATIGTVNANRDRWEVRDIIGLFVNMQCLRTIVKEGMSFQDLVQQVHEAHVASIAAQDVPFESIVSSLNNERDLSRHPLVQLVFVVHAQENLGKLVLEGVQTECLESSATTRFDLEFDFYQEPHSLRGDITFSTDLYSPQTISNVLSLFHHILRECLRDPGAVVASLPLFTDADYSQLDNMGLVKMERTAYPRDSSIVDLFRQQVAASPSKIAVKDPSVTMTYAELDKLSDALAQWLVKQAFAPETLVGVFAHRSCQTVVTFLGILKANLAYLPYDIKTPVERMEAILSSLPGNRRLVLVGDNVQLPDVKLRDVEFVYITTALEKQAEDQSAHRQLTSIKSATVTKPLAAGLAYVMFTSGSTGKPKGVMAEHRSVVRLVKNNNLVQHLPDVLIMAHMANLAFDASTWELYGTLLNGGTLVCVDAMAVLDPDALLQTFRQYDIRTGFLTTALFRQYTLECPAIIATFDMLCVGGEAMHPRYLRAAEKVLTGKFIHCYGPTENTTFSTTYLLPLHESCTNGVPIGRSINNSGAYVMDSKLRLVPLGVIGELVVTGDGLARGYTDPERNTDRFVSVVIAGQSVKAYRTGDYVRYRPTDGQLEIFGRMDGQIKIRGQRVELGEIEHVLRSHELVSDAVAVLQTQNQDGDVSQLAAFITVDEGTAVANDQGDPDEDDGLRNAASYPMLLENATGKSLQPQRLREIERHLYTMLHEKLPQYMIPQSITILEAIPINQNGKVDRQTLTQQRQTHAANRSPVQQPVSEAGKTMQLLWAQVLNIELESIGLSDSFFRLGGDSITAMKLVSKAHKIGLHLTIADVFYNPKLADLSSLESNTSSTAEEVSAFSLLGEGTDVVQIRKEVAVSCDLSDTSLVEDIYPCSSLQEGLLSLTSKRAGDYILQSVLELRDNIDEAALRRAWELVARSTTTLRTRIVHNSRLGLLQAVLTEEIRWQEGKELKEYLDRDRSVSMGLGDPLTRYAIIKGGKEDKRWLVWTIHHALYDGWSLPRIVNTVTATYNGATTELGARPGFHAFIKYLNQLDRNATTAYWQTTLADCQATPFPALQLAIQEPVADSTLTLQCPVLPNIPSDTTTSMLIRAAWAVVASCFTNSDDVVFGVTVTGRNAPVTGIETMVGPTISTIPLRVRIDNSQTVSAFLNIIQQQAIEMIPYEQTGLQRISKTAAGAQQACNFQTLLIVQSNTEELDDQLGEWRGHSDLQDFTTYGLVIQCTLATGALKITASFDRRIIDDWLVEKLLNQFNFVIQQLAQADSQIKMADITAALTPEDIQELWTWNRDIPASVKCCIHDLFTNQASKQPNAPAIVAWDGKMSYGDLDALSTRLGGHLVRLGVKPNDIVPLCFEKSMWTIVAILSVLKAGGAFLLLDPSLPHERLKSMCTRVAGTVALTSQEYVPIIKRLIKNVCIIEPAVLQIPQPDAWATTVQPTDTAYVIFTSGSTGEPKGCRIEHQSACSALVGHGHCVGMDRRTRTLQFGSYAFAGALAEILLTLVHGGCVCVPSEEERTSGLASAIARMQTNWAFLTSTVLELLSPQSVPSLTTLCVGGESIRISQLMEWGKGGQIHLRQTYGSSETSGFVSSERLAFGSSTTGDVGKASTGAYWIVDPSNHDKLMPIGAVGEVLIEGPILGREYIDDLDKTAATFIEAPAWRATFDATCVRLYKTGDLAKYKKDGSIELLGRKDSQVKIRGQRIELGEIEYQARLARANVEDTVVELIRPQQSSNNILACFIVVNTTQQRSNDGKYEAQAQAQARNAIRMIQDRLERFLPQYMVPTAFISIVRVPKTSSRKIDRKRLREIGASFTTQQLAQMQAVNQTQRRPPSTEAQKAMQKLWAQVLGLQPQSISLDDSFFRLGGDSIAAMKLVGEAGKIGIRLTVADIFRQPKLVDLSKLSHYTGSIAEETPAFSLLGQDVDAAQVREEVSLGYNIDAGLIEDIYPCSPLQEGLISLTSKRSGDYIMQSMLELRDGINKDAFQAAWRYITTQFTTTLRTRIVQHSKLGLLQAVIADEIKWQESERLEEYLEKDKSVSMGLGDPLTRYAMVEECTGKCWFVWTIHHALYDGWSLPQIVDTATRTYNDLMSGKQPSITFSNQPAFSAFIKHLTQLDRDAAGEYWRTALADCQAPPFPELPLAVQEPVADATLDLDYSALPKSPPSDITASTIVRAAWAVIASRYTHSDDVIFGATVTGRNAPIAGIATIVGPTIATVPIRVRVKGSQTVRDFLQEMQRQATEMIPYEQTGLQHIAKLAAGAPQACGFQTLLVVQPASEEFKSNGELGQWYSRSELQEFTTYGLVIQCSVSTDRIRISSSFDRRVVADGLAKRLLDQFSFVMQELTQAQPQLKMAEIDTLTPKDKKQLSTWNNEMPVPIERCIHDLFVGQASVQPEAPAICAWDGEMTYSELDKISTRLAGYLVVELGVKPDDTVPLIFEKSMWAIVAMMAVLKAGGAFVPLDPDHAETRYKEIFRHTGVHVLLTSGRHSIPYSGDSGLTIMAVNKSSIAQLPKQAVYPSVEPSNLAYIIFTSGSTGKPKGVMMEHRAFATGCLIHGESLGFSTDSRVLQFASYAFDASIQEIITTLLHGGCVCVPSDNDRRSNLANIINSMDVNFAILTSSVARLLDPIKLPSLKLLILVGEQVSFEDWARWGSRVRKINGYGPAECCIVCAAYKDSQTFNSGTIGKSIASISWIVDPDDHTILAPIGSVGELLVQGPILARGYLNDPEKTDAAFITNPPWLSSYTNGSPGRLLKQSRLYKTGDLVRYDMAGNLVYIGRKDTQVKIRGQRVELGEIEHHVWDCVQESVPEAQQTVVELISPNGGTGNAVLAAFLRLNNTVEEHGLLAKEVDATGPQVQMIFPSGIDEKLAKRLPSYMVPDVYFAISKLPLAVSGKTDRKRLREIGASFSAQKLAEMRTSSQGQKRLPTTKAETVMQLLWAQALNIRRDDIGLDDNFFRLGGDSITAMKLVGEAAKHGIRLTVANVFQQPKLLHLVRTLQAPAVRTTIAVPPFSLLPPGVGKASLLGSRSCIDGIRGEDVVDILPVTYVQRTYVDQGIEFPRLAFNYFYLDIGPHLDVDLLEDSCHRLSRHFPVLRTQFNYLDGRPWQIVLRDPKVPFDTHYVDGPMSEASHALCMRDIERANPLGLPTSFMLLRNGERQKRLIVRLSHAQYDGVCLQLILKTLVSIYQQEPLHPTTGFAAYIAHARQQRIASRQHWRGLLQGAHLTRVTANLGSCALEGAIIRAIKVKRSIDAPLLPAHATMASLVSSAWAVVLSTICGEEDVVYGQVIAGRNSDIPGISEMVGPCLNIVPVRARTPSTKTSEELIRSIQGQYLSLGQSDSMGWDEIVQKCTEWPAGSMYDSVILHQNINEEPQISFAGATATVQGFDNPFSIAPRLSILTQPRGKKLKITIAGNTSIMTAEVAHSLLGMLVGAIETLTADPYAPLASCKCSLLACAPIHS